MHKWKPNYIFEHYTEITPSWCKEHNIKFILSDLDGTLAAWNENADETFVNWYKSIEKVGVGVIIVSNNTKERVEAFINTCKLVGLSRCQKPSIRKIKNELIDKGLNPETSLFLGDQLLTDVWCAKRLGIQSAIVNPLGEFEPWQTKSKRGLEKLIKRTWKEK